ncbi:MAG: hypothetical protein BGO99_00290 [Nitrosospira sp. 56-18]|nr:MAG: hypothetical protein BGO99_00290 [Nitrosospira sp. 56-18]
MIIWPQPVQDAGWQSVAIHRLYRHIGASGHERSSLLLQHDGAWRRAGSPHAGIIIQSRDSGP